MPNVKNTIIDTMLSFVAPHLCSGCGNVGMTFCDNCKYNIISEPFVGCIVCGCVAVRGVCNDHNTSINQAWVVGVREGPLRQLIGRYKFRNIKMASVDIADLLHQRLPALPNSVVVVSIPTTAEHIRARGYDHMALIAVQFARRRHLLVEKLLTRRHSLVQHHANRTQRLVQASTAFRIDGLVDPSKIYLVLDDVVTTGATLQSAAKLLCEAGATVWVAAIARQPLD